jgi:cytochrome c biogenesis protein CcdA
VWGVLSIVLSPCHRSSIPLIVGFIIGQGRTTTARAFGVATVFAVGILITIAAVGAITAAVGRLMGDVGRWGNYLVAVVFFAVGLYLLGLIPMPWSGPGQVSTGSSAESSRARMRVHSSRLASGLRSPACIHIRFLNRVKRLPMNAP